MEKNILLGISISEEEMKGLGIITRDPKVAEAVTQLVAKKVAETSILEKDQKYLIARQADFTSETKAAVSKGELTFEDKIYMARVEIPASASGIQEVIKSSTDEEAGVMSFAKGGKLHDYANMSVSRIGIRYDNNASQVGVKNAAYAALSSGNTDQSLENGEIRMQINGKTVFSAPVNNFKNGIRGLNESEKAFYNLDKPIFIPEKASIQFLLVLPDGSTMGSGVYHYVEVSIFGSATKLSVRY